MSGAELLDHLVGVGGAVWRASWQASVLAVLVLAVQMICGTRLSARWRHAMWMLVLVRLALPAVPSSPLSVFNLAPASKAPAAQSAPLPTVELEWAATAWRTPNGAEARGAMVPPLAASRIDTSPFATPQAAQPATGARSPDLWTGWPQVLARVWALGALLLALRIAWATWRVARTLRKLDAVDDPAVHALLRATAAELRVRRLPLLLTGDGQFSPALVGFVRPRLLLPRDLLASFAPAELRLIFLHELAHLKRRDVAINWAATLLTVVHWLNPIVWLVMWRLRLERELACDELVLSRTSDSDRRAYGHTILKLLETFSRGAAGARGRPLPVGSVGILEGKAQMKRRIIMIAQFARSSRAWTVIAAALVLTLGVVALTDAVQAEEPSKPATQPARQQKTIKMADGTIVSHAGPDDLVQRTVTVNGQVVATNDYDRLAGPVPGGELTLAQPSQQGHTPSPTNEEIAQGDPAMRQYLSTLAQLEDERARTSHSVGEKHPSIVALDDRIKETKQLIAEHGEQRRAQMRQPTKIKAGDLVAVSIMDLVGQGVETLKTARVDGDGTINLPFAGQVKASGLSPRELERAVAKALQDQKLVQDAVVAVSMPERGESHQIARARQPAPGGGGGMDPMVMLDPAMMEDPAMMGMGIAAPAARVEEDPAAQAILSRKLPELKLDGIPFGDVVDFLRDTTGLNIFVNWRGLEAHGIDRSAPVTMRLRDVALKDVLSLLTRSVGQGAMTYKIENGVVVIDVQHQAAKPAKAAKLVTEAYNVSHLLGGGTEKELKSKVIDLQKVIMTTVQPQTWQGGSGVSTFDLRLIITASEDVHRDVKQLLKMLERNGSGEALDVTPAPATKPAAGREEQF